MKAVQKWDRIGAWAGAICAVHCALTGAALGLLSIVGLGFIGSPTGEALFVLSAVVLGVTALVHGVRRHHSWVPALGFAAGLTFIALAHFLFEHGTLGSAILSIAGGLCLMAFHLLNIRYHNACSRAGSSPCCEHHS